MLFTELRVVCEDAILCFLTRVKIEEVEYRNAWFSEMCECHLDCKALMRQTRLREYKSGVNVA